MKVTVGSTVLIAVILCLSATAALAQTDAPVEQPGTEKRAQTSFKFLSVSTAPRVAAIADAVTAVEGLSSQSLFYNPAAMARMGSRIHAAMSQTRWIGDIDYNAASLSFRPAGGIYGVIGVSIMAVNYGEVIGTIRADNERGYLDYSEIGLSNPSPSALTFGVGYARGLTDRFAVGGHVKYAQQDMDEGVLSAADASYSTTGNGVGTVAFDFGVLYNTGFRSLNFAMSARNFSRELTYVEENFELPLTFRIGLSMNMADLADLNTDMHSLLLAVDAERPRDFDEQLKIGGEYTFMRILSLRAGYAFPSDIQGMNVGVGVHHEVQGFGIGADYGYSSLEVFDDVHRLSIEVSF